MGARSSRRRLERSPSARVLIVNPDPVARCSLMGILTKAAYDTLACASMEEGLALTGVTDFMALVIDVAVAPPSATDLRATTHLRADMPVMIMTAGHSEVGTAVAALRDGYHDFITPPFDERLIQAIERASETPR